MLGEKRVHEITDRVLSLSRADQTEVLLLGDDTQLTRFANSYIHQNVATRDIEVRVRVVMGKKIGVASTNDLSPESLERVVEAAMEIARYQPDNPDFVSLPEPMPITPVDAFVEATATCTPEERAKAVRGICRYATENKLIASGAFSTSASEIAIANSLGIFAYTVSTMADLNTVIMSDTSAGYASRTSMDVRQIDSEAIGREAVDKALRSRNPTDIEPGEYTVILEEYAVAEILDYLSYVGFSALAVQEGRSFMADSFGKRIVGENISIWDDGFDSQGLPMPFDFEGVPKQRVDLIQRGIARAVVYDTYTANREGKRSTGHALPAPNTFGPIPLNLFMAPGDVSKEEMLSSTSRGLWVTRFHYVNVVHPLKAVLTGMTRDGTFWIEGGEIAYPVKNLRFTQGILEALSHVEQIGRQLALQKAWLGATVVPALKITSFNFTGATEF